MSEQDSGQEAFAAALSGAEAPAIETVVEPASTTTAPEAAPQGEPAPGGQPGAEQTDRGDHVPSWRLREVAEERRREAEARQMLERRVADFERKENERQRQAEEEAQKAAEFDWEKPVPFMDQRFQSGIQKALSPIEQQFREFVVETSREQAYEKHGQEQVDRASREAMAAYQAGDQSAIALDQRVSSSKNPFREIMAWHKQRTVMQETGGDLEAFLKKQREQWETESLNDAAFQQKVIERTRQQARPVTTGDPRKSPAAIPSLNRTTAGADISDEEDDPNAVFQTAFATRGRK
jgi:hypothetical protein